VFEAAFFREAGVEAAERLDRLEGEPVHSEHVEGPSPAASPRRAEPGQRQQQGHGEREHADAETEDGRVQQLALRIDGAAEHGNADEAQQRQHQARGADCKQARLAAYGGTAGLHHPGRTRPSSDGRL
jgi:hypothetical protein